LQIVNAATKEKKNRDLERLKTLATAEETLLVAGFRYQGLTVR
jgi:large subunit ribosomal protein L10